MLGHYTTPPALKEYTRRFGVMQPHFDPIISSIVSWIRILAGLRVYFFFDCF